MLKKKIINTIISLSADAHQAGHPFRTCYLYRKFEFEFCPLAHNTIDADFQWQITQKTFKLRVKACPANAGL